ncbi:GNAT family N-acetyltransferase [Nocardioides sp.]|uniref:GNAT family N-acetyltransferase n=1 Tax=Nocardioides sp. TaxID=35761 RepID=UPI0026362D66|nr:GNAT family N-acetyltransferase [Nocardioides sp.]
MTITPPPVPTLSDGDVVLRALGEQDVEGCYEQCVDPLSVRWTTVPTPFSREDAREFCLEIAPGAWADGSQWIFAVETHGRYAGNIALRDEGHGRAEIAYGAHPAARGTGAMERALRMLIDWGFAAMGVQTVIWRANVGNWASRKLAWRLGFTLDGTLRHSQAHRGELVDAWVGTLLVTDKREPKGRWLTIPTVDGESVRLRPLTEADVPRIVEACSDERTQHWLGQLPTPYGAADAREWMRLNTEGQARGTKITWAITGPPRDRDDTLLGAINIFDIAEVDCEVGYWAHPDARGRGMMSAAMRLATAYAFDHLGVRRVRAFAALENAASRHVIESAGLTQTGIERLGTVLRTGPADMALYDVLVEEWTARSSASEVR